MQPKRPVWLVVCVVLASVLVLSNATSLIDFNLTDITAEVPDIALVPIEDLDNLSLAENETWLPENATENITLGTNESADSSVNESVNITLNLPPPEIRTARVYIDGEAHKTVLVRDDYGFELRFGFPDNELGSSTESWGDTPRVLIQGIENPEDVIIRIGENLQGGPITTPVISANAIEFDRAEVMLPKNGRVNRILGCEEFDLDGFLCESGWRETNIPFTDNGESISFEIDGFSAYAGAYITVINVFSHPTVGGEWTVRFLTKGIADLIITPVAGTRFGEDLEFLELRCGMDIREAEYDGESILYRDWECPDEGRETSRVLTADSHHLKFIFGFAYALAHNFIPAYPWVTSWNSLGGDYIPPFRTNDAMPTVNFTTVKNANCRIDNESGAYGDMTTQCSGGEGTKVHICTMPETTGDGPKRAYVACDDGTNMSQDNLAYTLDTTLPYISVISPAYNSTQGGVSVQVYARVNEPARWCLYDITGSNQTMTYQSTWTKDDVDLDVGGAVRGVAIGDADNDNEYEMVSVTSIGNISLYEGSYGSWTATIIDNIGSSVTAVDIGDSNDDGLNDVVVGTSTSKKVYYYENLTGVWRNWTIDGDVGGSVLSLDIGDADNDGDNEVVVGTTLNFIYMYEGSNNSWTRYAIDENASDEIGDITSVKIGDADNDGDNEVVAGGAGTESKVLIYEGYNDSWTRTVIDSNQPGSSGVQTVDVGDADNDGLNDIVIGTVGTQPAVFLYNGSGSDWDRETVYSGLADSVYSVVIGDVDDDNWNEIVAGTRANDIYSYKKNATWSENIVDGDAGGDIRSLAIGDADNDGLMGICVGIGTGGNDVLVYNGSTTNWAASTTLPDGRYNVTVYCLDTVGLLNYTIHPFNVDLNSPSITLNYPSLEEKVGNSTVGFNFTAYDSVDIQMECNLTLDGVVNQTGLIAINGIPRIVAIDDLSEGEHNWSIRCVDDANNSNASETRKFYIDLTPPWVVQWVSVDSDRTHVFRTNSTTPVINFTTNEEAYCRINNQSGGYSDMVIDCINGGTKNQSCTMPETKNDGTKAAYIACNDTLGNEDNSSQYDIVYYVLDTRKPMIDILNPGYFEAFDQSLVDLNVSVDEPADNCWYNVTGSYVGMDYWPFWDNNSVDSTIGSDIKSIVVGDGDNDFENEVAVGTADGHIYLYEFNGSGWDRHTVIDNAGGEVKSLAIGDPDNDGYKEIVAGIATVRAVYYYENTTGSWISYEVEDDIGSTMYDVVVGDADNDGFEEVVVAAGTYVYYYQFFGGQWVRYRIAQRSNDVRAVAIGDLDNDGDNEVVAGTNVVDNNIFIYEGSDYSWSETQITTGSIGGVLDMELGDVDTDGLNEILVGTEREDVYVFEGSSLIKRTLTLDAGGDVVDVSIGDANDDNRNDAILGVGGGIGATAPHRIVVYNGSADSWNELVIENSTGGDTYVAVGDANNDGLNEIIAGAVQDLTIYNGSTRTWAATMNLPDGRYNVTVYCQDGAGHINSTTQPFIIDSGPPKLSFVNPTDDNDSYVPRNWTFINVSVIEGSLHTLLLNWNGTNESMNGSGAVWWENKTNLTDGTYWYYVWANDSAGGENQTETRIIHVDTTPPLQFDLITPANNSVQANQTPRLVWENTSELNFDNYTIQLSNLSNFSVVVHEYNTFNITNTTYNVSDILNEGLWYWRVVAYDEADNNFTTGIWRYIVDFGPPQIHNESKTPAVVYNDDDVTFFVNVTDAALEVVWIEGNWSGSMQNYTVTNHVGDRYNITIPYTNFDNGERVFWRFWANDSGGFTNQTQWHNFTVQNRLPSVPQPLISPTNDSTEIFNNILFNWTASSDADNDVLTYELMVANDTGFTEIEVNRTGISSSYYDTGGTMEYLSNGTKYWRVRACDPFNCSDWSYYNYFTSIYAAINISVPSNWTVIRPGQLINFTIEEVLNGEWIDNMTMTIMGVTYYVSGDPNWYYNWTVPDVSPRYVNVTVRGYNGSKSNVYTEDYITLLLSRGMGLAASPSILSVCSNQTYALNSSNITITIVADLDTLLGEANLTVTEPGMIAHNLDYEYYECYGLSYYIYYTFEINKTGVFNMSAQVEDIEGQTDSLSFYFVSTIDTKNLNFTAYGVDRIELRDICRGEVLAVGTRIEKTVPDGIYDIWLGVAQITTIPTYDITMLFYELWANESWTDILNYTFLRTDYDSPPDRRDILMFKARPNLTYDKFNLTWNYSTVDFMIHNESLLEMWNCPFENNSQCIGNWLNITTVYINASSNFITGDLETVPNVTTIYIVEPGVGVMNVTYNITVNVTNITIINITIIENVTETITKTRTVEVEVEVEKEVQVEVEKEVKVEVQKLYSVQLVAPSYKTMYWNDTIEIPFIVRNPEKTTLEEILVSAASNDTRLSVSLDHNRIRRLNPTDFESFTVTLRTARLITPELEPIRYSINLSVDVGSPEFDDYTMVYVDVLPRIIGKESDIRSKVEFVRELFRDNPICLELSEVVDEAVIALNTGQYEKANFLLSSAIDECRVLLSKPAVVPQIVVGSPAPTPWTWIALSIILLIILLIMAVKLMASRGNRGRFKGRRGNGSNAKKLIRKSVDGVTRIGYKLGGRKL